MKALQDNRGLTMVEMIVALALFSIIVILSSGIMLSSANAFGRAATMDSGKQLGEAVYDYIGDALAYAVMVEVNSDTEGYAKGIKIQDGQLYTRSAGEEFTALYSDEVYGGRLLEIQTLNEGDLMYLTVKVMREEKVLFTKSSAVRMVNVEGASGSALSCPAGEQLTNPEIYYQ